MQNKGGNVQQRNKIGGFNSPQLDQGVEDPRKVPLPGPAHPESGAVPGVLAAEVGSCEKISSSLEGREEGGGSSARAFPEFFPCLPGSGSVVNHYYCM